MWRDSGRRCGPVSYTHLDVYKRQDYLHVGADLARAGLPTVFVFEGGYAVAEVGVNTVNVLEGFAQQAGC